MDSGCYRVNVLLPQEQEIISQESCVLHLPLFGSALWDPSMDGVFRLLEAESISSLLIEPIVLSSPTHHKPQFSELKEPSLYLDQPKIKMQQYKQETFSYSISCVAFPIFMVSTVCSYAGHGCCIFGQSNTCSCINSVYKHLWSLGVVWVER